MIGAAVIVVVTLAVALFEMTKVGGEQAVKGVRQDLQQAGAAADVQARANLSVALQAAQAVFVESGSYTAADPNALSATESSLHYTTGPSTGPDVVSVASSATDWGAAVMSSSGTCLYIHASGAGVSQGSGVVCTGQAALGS